MEQYQFKTTIEKGMIFIPESILNKLSSQVKVIIQAENIPTDMTINNITLASEESLSKDWLLPEEDLIWQDL
ncbi:MAG: DUF2281 domain-containing protein [Bacteroidetes bacterium]|nr:DUF2281 domain-containing protein [Bacteroidota bacterium]